MVVLPEQLGEGLLHLLAAWRAGAGSQCRHLVPCPGLGTHADRAYHEMVVGSSNVRRIKALATDGNKSARKLPTRHTL